MSSTVKLHQTAFVETSEIGSGTEIMAFCYVSREAIIGSNCTICDHVVIEGDCTIGNGVTIKSGARLCNGVVLEDNVFIGSNVTFSEEPPPHNGQDSTISSEILVRHGATIGANATLLPRVTIGSYAIVGAGSVVTHNVPPYASVAGNPAQIIGYVQSSLSGQPATLPETADSSALGKHPTMVAGVCVYELPLIKDLRGNLSVGEFSRSVPFTPQRYFLVFDVPSSKVRGEHAHRKCHQFLICIKGSCSLVVDDGRHRQEILLDRPNKGVHLPPMVWGVQYKYSPDTVLLVFASDYYEAGDYIRDYDEFICLINAAA